MQHVKPRPKYHKHKLGVNDMAKVAASWSFDRECRPLTNIADFWGKPFGSNGRWLDLVRNDSPRELGFPRYSLAELSGVLNHRPWTISLKLPRRLASKCVI